MNNQHSNEHILDLAAAAAAALSRIPNHAGLLPNKPRTELTETLAVCAAHITRLQRLIDKAHPPKEHP